MKIGIVGGSIAGCSAAILFQNEGIDVTVYERSNKPLVGRGGGIGTTTGLLNEIRKDGLLNEDFAKFHINKMPLVGKTSTHEPFGKTAWELPMSFEVFQWNELWKSLRANVVNDNYKPGVKIVKACETENGKIELTTDKGDTAYFDLVLFADGYNSLGRKLLFPEQELKYRGYVLWRGLLPENEMPERCPLENDILRLSYDGEPGHNVVYYIPNQNGSTTKGDRVLNWAAYIAIPSAELTGVLTDKDGRQRTGTIPPGYLSDVVEAKLKTFLSANTPAYYADMVRQTNDSYIQVIYTVDLDSYYKGNMCLIGDAGMVVQPFTGSGVFKGYHNAKDLIACLKQFDNTEKALAQWSKNQIQSGKGLLALGEQMEKAFIWNQPDFAHMEAEDTKKWWQSSVTFPEDFNYDKS